MQRHGLLATSIMPYQAPMKISTSFSLVILLASLAELHAADPPQAPAAGDSGSAANPPRNPSIETQELVAEPPDETRAVVTIDSGAPSVRYSPMIFGGFLEHFERQIYGGLFEPGSPLADARGFRRDAIAALKELKVPITPLFPALRSASTAVSEAIRPKQIPSIPGKHAWEPRASVVGGSVVGSSVVGAAVVVCAPVVASLVVAVVVTVVLVSSPQAASMVATTVPIPIHPSTDFMSSASLDVGAGNKCRRLL